MRTVRNRWAALMGGIAALGVIGIVSSQSLAQDERNRQEQPRQDQPRQDQAREDQPRQDQVATKAAPTRARCLGYPLEETRIIDRETLFARDQFGSAALIKMKGPCLEPNEAISLRYFGTTQICGPLDVDISGSALTGISQRCMIDKVTPLSKDEAKAYLHGK